MSEITLKTLVLNPNFMPISVFPNLYTISAKEALVRHFNKNCDVVYWYDRHVLTPSRSDLYWPSVIVNNSSRSFSKEVRLKRSTLYYREHMRCFWCDDEIHMDEVTYDHIMPRSKGGKHVWENVVSSCKECNSAKGDSLPIGKWTPKKKVYKPSFFELLEIRKKMPLVIEDENWSQFLPGFTNTILKPQKH